MATFNKKILFNNSMEILLDANIGNKNSNAGGADGIGVGFHSSPVNSIGLSGNGFGVRGL